mmetsp:Transcript_38786/g.56621  ORF Transcript_38786/g.56621 Transcript_38786/m.56621 type:complete len:82 (-) Transcript_38786:519-764(-)
MCATSSGVGNAGIDSSQVRCVIRTDFPPTQLDIIQELGRAGRNRDTSFENYSYNIYISIEQFIYVYERIHDPREKILDEKY